MSEIIEQFAGVGDDGEAYWVVVRQDILAGGTRSMKEIWVGDRRANWVDQDTVRIVTTGVVVRRR